MNIEDIKVGKRYLYHAGDNRCFLGTCEFIGADFIVVTAQGVFTRVMLPDVYCETTEWGKPFGSTPPVAPRSPSPPRKK